MKLVSWNVNGFLEYVKNEDPDVICLQETKLQPEQAVFELEGYHRYFYSAEKKGYSGTAVLTRQEPISVVFFSRWRISSTSLQVEATSATKIT